MLHRAWPIVVGILSALVSVSLVRALADDDRYTIMRPEPWLPPKYQSPRGSTVSVKLIPRVVGGCKQVERWSRPTDVGVSFYVCAYA